MYDIRNLDPMYRYIWLIPILPLLGAAINGLLGRVLHFSERVVGIVAVGSIALTFLLALLSVYSYGFGGEARWPAPYLSSENGGFEYTWIPGGQVTVNQPRESKSASPNPANSNASSADLRIKWRYQLDALSCVFILIVSGVGLCIFVFALGYMHGDAGFYRFFSYLGLFMFSMLVLVLGSNFLMMFVGWEGVGLCSYLLIGYYFDRKAAGDASRKAFVTNRIGDFGMILAISAIISTFGTTEFTDVVSRAASFPIEVLGNWHIMSWIALGLFVGACGKSAQIPLFVWLPDAMAGPTPVSALIHAATMVTAGLYMLARTNVIFLHSQTMMLVVAIIGTATALVAAFIAITQTDIKKVLAYSTISQLGFMCLACGVGAFTIGVFHVMTHAFFKALLFLGAGSVIHSMHHEQDMRRMGGLKKYLPYTYATFLVGWLAISGVFPLSGFWSKDEILWRAASTSVVPYGWIFWLGGTVAAFFTAFYMTRLVAMTFWGKERFFEVSAGDEADEAHAHAFDLGFAPHDSIRFSVGDRPMHEPGEHVGVAHEIHAAHSGTHVHTAHEHGSFAPHESPRSMYVPLIVLAILATVGGLIGVGPAFKSVTGSEHPGGRLNIVTWLNPIIWQPATGKFGGSEEEEIAKPESSAGDTTVYSDTGFNMARSLEKSWGVRATEWFFILLSLAVAAAGILTGMLFYVSRPALPDVWAARLQPLYTLSFNKLWVDELYGTLFTRRTHDLARGVFGFDSRIVDGIVNGCAAVTRFSSRMTGMFDKYIVDGLVNGVANFIGSVMSAVIRTAQTGLAPNYALVMVLGVVVVVALYLGGDLWLMLRSIFAMHL